MNKREFDEGYESWERHLTNRDARQRAFRSFMWGLLIDVSVALVMLLSTAFDDIIWTGTFWATLGLLSAKTVLQSIVAYLARRLIPPKP